MIRNLRVGDRVTVKVGASTHPKFWEKQAVIAKLIDTTFRGLTFYRVYVGKDKIPQCLTKSELKGRD